MIESDRSWQSYPALHCCNPIRPGAGQAEVTGCAGLGLASSPRRRVSLLIVSAEPDRLAEVAALAAEDFEVQTADGVGAALQVLASADIDLLLADQALQPMAGLQLLDWAREHSPRTVGLLLVGPADVEQAGEALRLGRAFSCVLYPLRADGLLATLRGATRQGLRVRGQAVIQQELRRLQLDLQQKVLEQGRWLEQAAEMLIRNAADLEEDNRRLRQHTLEMECQATTDPLTGLLNRRAIEAVAVNEFCRRSRQPGPLALGLIDADHFKEINARHLLPGGDQALIGLAGALAGSVRTTDRVGRFGGEEFLVVAPHTDAVGAAVLAERLRAAVEQTAVSYNGNAITVTVSIGFAVAEECTPSNYNDLRHAAAAALAEAKAAGRNCCVVQALAPSARRLG